MEGKTKQVVEHHGTTRQHLGTLETMNSGEHQSVQLWDFLPRLQQDGCCGEAQRGTVVGLMQGWRFQVDNKKDREPKTKG